MGLAVCRQAQVARGDVAEEALRNRRQQHEQMSAQLFSLNQQHRAVSQHNQTLLQQNAALQAEKAALEQRLQQQKAEKEDEVRRLLVHMPMPLFCCWHPTAAEPPGFSDVSLTT